MDANNIIDDGIVAQLVVFGIVNEEAALIAGNNIILDHRILNGSQHDAVIGVAPRTVVAHDLVAHVM